MLWLKTINAIIDISNKTITIENTKKRKTTKIINSYIINSKTFNCDKKNKKLTKKKLIKLKKNHQTCNHARNRKRFKIKIFRKWRIKWNLVDLQLLFRKRIREFSINSIDDLKKQSKMKLKTKTDVRRLKKLIFQLHDSCKNYKNVNVDKCEPSLI